MKNIRFAALIAFIFLFASGLSAREFLNTFMQINIGYSYGLSINGDMLDAENRNKSVDRKLKYVNDSFNFMTDLVPFKPIFLGDESHALKIGVRGGYRMHFVEQKTTISGEDYGGDLMGYSTFVFGPLIRYAPSISFFSD
ncbi:MAG: hypothetical protein LBT84_07890, partial [Spirochaetia bacterium]|nr:hypothetical protein [Spirochaetia bacterium]